MKNKTEKVSNDVKQGTGDQKYEKFASGLIIVKSENSNFNADFTHTPRRLPDDNGTIYATDKSLKYCIRKYLKDNNQTVFAWRRKAKDGNPMNIDENYKWIFEIRNGTLGDKKGILKNLVECIDIRLFGVTFAPEEKKKNVSLTGPVQISYGINKYNENVHYSNQILSPYQPKEEGQQTTIGDESKALESHYVFDFIVNPNHLKDSIDHLSSEDQKNMVLTKNDIELFKEAARRGVSNVNSTTKIGSENELLLYVEYDKPIMLQNLKDFISVKKEDNKSTIDLTALIEYLNDLQTLFSSGRQLGDSEDQSSNVGVSNDVGQGEQSEESKTQSILTLEVYYEPKKTDVKGLEKINNWISLRKFDLLTGVEQKNQKK